MLAKTAIQKISLAAFTLSACAAGVIATAPSAAHADTFSRPGSGVLKSTDGGAAAGTFTLTFQGQTTSAAKDGGNYEYTWSVQSGRDAATGGNVEFDWKVQEGESAPLAQAQYSIVIDRRPATSEDINIGVGELQECTISKSMDMATPKLTQFAVNGNSAAGDDHEVEFDIVAGR